MGALFARFRLVRTVLGSGRLALRLLRDSRTPLMPKLILGGAILYLLSPLDFVPDFIPVVGQLDDIAVLMLGLELFFKSVPPWLKAEHEAALGRASTGERVIDMESRPPRL